MPKRSNPLGQLEQSLAALEEFSKTAPELVASLRDTLERYKGGEVDSAALYDAATALSGPFTQAHTKHFDVLWTTEDIDRDEGLGDCGMNGFNPGEFLRRSLRLNVIYGASFMSLSNKDIALL